MDRAEARSTLGLREVAELRAAMDAVANRGDVDADSFGLWGVNLGAYVALAEASRRPSRSRGRRGIRVQSIPKKWSDCW